MTSSTDSTVLYMQECGNHSLLSADREMELLKRAKLGDRKARDELIQKNQRLVIKIANKYLGMAGDQEMIDLVQFGNLALIKAINLFDVSTGYRFSTYAALVIRTEIRRNALIFGEQITSSYDASSIRSKFPRTIDTLFSRLHRNPTIEEIAGEMHLERKKAQNIWLSYIGAISLDLPVSTESSEESTIGELIAVDGYDVQEQAEADDMLINLKIAIRKLTPIERAVVSKQYGLDSGSPMSFDEISKHHHISKDKAQGHAKNAMTKLRDTLNVMAPG